MTPAAHLGHDLGLDVVAEGVQSAGVRQRLLEMGCDEMQGFVLAHPMPIEQVLRWLAGHAQTDRAERAPVEVVGDSRVGTA